MAKKVNKSYPNGYYHIHTIDIINNVVDAVLGCYGIVAVADKYAIKDDINPNNQKGKVEEGVQVSRFSDHSFAVTVYLIVAENLKMTETLRECQKRVKYVLDKAYPNRCRFVSVFGVGIASK